MIATDKPDSRRYFRVLYNKTVVGRVSGFKAKQAANKALTCILRENKSKKISTQGKINFTIKDCTRGSNQKEYKFVGERVELKPSMDIIIKNSSGSDRTIQYKYKNVVKKIVTDDEDNNDNNDNNDNKDDNDNKDTEDNNIVEPVKNIQPKSKVINL